MIDRSKLSMPYSSVYDDWFTGDIYLQIAQYLSNKDIKLCVDIGASCGIVTQWILDKINPDKIICFEPDQINFHELQKNLSDCDNIEFHNIGIYYGLTESKVYGNGDNSPLG